MQIDKIKLRAAIASKCLQISEVQRAADLNGSTLYRLVNQGGAVRLSTVGKLSKVLDVDPMSLVLEDELL